jgi:hypothetical protein
VNAILEIQGGLERGVIELSDTRYLEEKEIP